MFYIWAYSLVSKLSCFIYYSVNQNNFIISISINSNSLTQKGSWGHLHLPSLRAQLILKVLQLSQIHDIFFYSSLFPRIETPPPPYTSMRNPWNCWSNSSSVELSTALEITETSALYQGRLIFYGQGSSGEVRQLNTVYTAKLVSLFINWVTCKMATTWFFFGESMKDFMEEFAKCCIHEEFSKFFPAFPKRNTSLGNDSLFLNALKKILHWLFHPEGVSFFAFWVKALSLVHMKH